MRSLRTRLELAMSVGDAQDAQDDAVRALASGRKFFFGDVASWQKCRIMEVEDGDHASSLSASESEAATLPVAERNMQADLTPGISGTLPVPFPSPQLAPSASPSSSIVSSRRPLAQNLEPVISRQKSSGKKKLRQDAAPSVLTLDIVPCARCVGRPLAGRIMTGCHFQSVCASGCYIQSVRASGCHIQ